MHHAMLRGSVVPFALAALAACATEPRGPVLTGQFGGRMLGMVATDTAVHFQFACGYAVTGPLRLESGGAYRAIGLGTDGFPPGAAPSWSLDVTAGPIGDSLLGLLVVSTRRYQDSTSRSSGAYQVTRGAAPDFSGVACLAD